ncbi:hypothetical protein E0H84_04670 [Acinetobacter terrestris]|nr:hypothetical protein E0H84_04670 [Acinetobacter terrestris]
MSTYTIVLGGMNVAVRQGLHGCTLCLTKDFCHSSSLKSEALPTQIHLNFSLKIVSMLHSKNFYE